VLNFRRASSADFDERKALEDRPVETLGNSAVDGHDLRSGYGNIYIFTDNPEATLE